MGVLATTTGTHSYGSPALQAEASNGAPVAAFYGFDQSVVIDTGANIHTTGEIYTAGTCTSGCIRRNIESYATTAAVPTIEDYGEAQTSAGITYVRLDRVFANVIDPQQGYLVFVTPEGDTRGLYVTQRTATGFAVREIGGGHGKVPFAYRIVAHPLGKRLPRLPVNELPALHSASR